MENTIKRTRTKEEYDLMEQIKAEPNSWTDEAFRLFKSLLEIAQRNGNSYLEGYCHAALSRYYYFHSEYDKCNEELRLGVPIQEANNDSESLSITYNLLGIDAMNRGYYSIGLEYLKKVIMRAAYVEKEKIATVYVNLGYVHYDVGDIDRGMEYCRKAIEVLEKCKDNFNYLIALEQQAAFSIYLNDLNEAEIVIEKIRKFVEDAKKKWPDEIFPDLAEVQVLYYNAVGNIEKRNAAMDEFTELIGKTDAYIDFIRDILWVTDTMLEAGETERVSKLFDKMRVRIIESGIKHLELEFIERDIRLNKLKGNYGYVKALKEKFFDISLAKKDEDTAFYKRNVELADNIEKLIEEKKKIAEDNQRLKKEASLDSMTRLPNRAYFNSKAEEMLNKAKHFSINLGVEMLDIDFFKQYNDTFGHQEGDKCIMQIADIIRSVCDESTFASRYGGDEFILVYCGLDDKEIMDKSDCIRKKVAERMMKNPESETSDFITVSQGIINKIPEDDSKVSEYTFAADHALYKVKENRKGNILLVHENVLSTE